MLIELTHIKIERMTWFCYILRNTDERWKHQTYNGSTNNPVRRLRQHNEEISGGARATHGKGGAWEIYALVSGFPDHVNALSCEWRIKHPNGKPGRRDPKYSGERGRIVGLREVLELTHWTKQCVVENSCMDLHVWIVEEYSELMLGLPTNVTVHVVDSISKEFLSGLLTVEELCPVE
jgi:predicted GIY-YIG superfamily endonuclease